MKNEEVLYYLDLYNWKYITITKAKKFVIVKDNLDNDEYKLRKLLDNISFTKKDFNHIINNYFDYSHPLKFDNYVEPLAKHIVEMIQSFEDIKKTISSYVHVEDEDKLKELKNIFDNSFNEILKQLENENE